MVFWQLTVDANDPALLARFWARALGYRPVPPTEPQTTRQAHYRARLGEQAAFDDRIFDPAGLGPPIWFQEVPETKAGKNRLHMDLYPTGRDMALPLERRIEIVEATVAEHAGLGASVERRTRHDDPMTRCTNVGTPAGLHQRLLENTRQARACGQAPEETELDRRQRVQPLLGGLHPVPARTRTVPKLRILDTSEL